MSRHARPVPVLPWRPLLAVLGVLLALALAAILSLVV